MGKTYIYSLKCSVELNMATKITARDYKGVKTISSGKKVEVRNAAPGSFNAAAKRVTLKGKKKKNSSKDSLDKKSYSTYPKTGNSIDNIAKDRNEKSSVLGDKLMDMMNVLGQRQVQLNLKKRSLIN